MVIFDVRREIERECKGVNIIMPNILITQYCVRSCPYCFAKKHMSESSPTDMLSWEDLIYLADFLWASGERKFRILGGEPTLHPEFNNMVLYLLERGFDITVFTSGIMADSKLLEAEFLFRDLPPERLNFMCNTNDPQRTHTPLAEQESIKRFFRAFGNKVSLGLNVYKLDFSMDFLVQYINEFGLQRHIRVGIAHPIPGKKNLFLPLDAIDRVIERLFSYAPLLDRFRVKTTLDCGFPLCRISNDQLGWIQRVTGGQTRFGCNPVIDIGPDMSVWPCFPLSDFHKKSIYDFNSMREVIDFYQKYHDVVRIEAGGIFGACDECTFREEHICSGGCIAHCVSRFQNEAPIRMKDVYL